MLEIHQSWLLSQQMFPSKRHEGQVHKIFPNGRHQAPNEHICVSLLLTFYIYDWSEHI